MTFSITIFLFGTIYFMDVVEVHQIFFGQKIKIYFFRKTNSYHIRKKIHGKSIFLTCFFFAKRLWSTWKIDYKRKKYILWRHGESVVRNVKECFFRVKKSDFFYFKEKKTWRFDLLTSLLIFSYFLGGF